MNIDNEHIFQFDFDFNRTILLEEFKKNRHLLEVYGNERDGASYNLKKVIVPESDYIIFLKKFFQIPSARPRFYSQDPNSTLTPHKDFGTLCSLNILLNEDTAAPITIEGKDYYYTHCLLNTTSIHGVNTGNAERILFKLSIFDETYESVKERFKKILQNESS